MTRSRASVVLAATIAIALVLLGSRTTFALWRFATAARELPLWDEAKYGLDGARLAAAIADLDLPRFAKLVYGLDVWPPLFPLAQAAVFLAAGDSFAAARGLMAVLFLGAVLAAFWAGREIAPDSPAVAALAAALFLASPLVQLFATHAMLELPGALLLLLALGSYARFLRTGARRALLATGLLTSALFFTKYNYGLLWMAPLLVSEAWIACGGARAVLSGGAVFTRRIDLSRPLPLFIALYLAGLLAVVVTGGGTLRLGDEELSVTSIGNPLSLLLALLLARAALRPRRSWLRFRDWERGLAERHRVLLWTVGAPAAIWLALPPHLRSFVDFVDNRGARLPVASAANLLYHPRGFVEEYHAAPFLGVVVLALAGAAWARIGRASPGVRVTLLAGAVGLAAAMLHPYKEPRFFFVTAPLVWLAASWSAVTVAEAVAARLRLPPRWANAAVAVAVLVVAARLPASARGLGESFARHTAPAASAVVIDRVADLAAERTTVVAGTWNQASPALVEWRFRQRHPGHAALPETVVPSTRTGSAERLLRRLSGAAAPAQVALLELDEAGAPSLEWAAAFRAETAWLEPVRAALASGALSYVESGQEVFPGTGYRLRVYARSTRGQA